MIALIDGDILTYRVGFASQDIDVALAWSRLKTVIEDIVEATKADKYIIYLTSNDKSNFRFKLFPEYKANRKAPKPIHYHELRAAMVADYGAEVVSGREADDALADAQYYIHPGTNSSDVNVIKQTVICSIDKDLDQIPGEHYNFVKKLEYTVTPEEGRRFFYRQLLTGDRTDNVLGIEGIGDVKADRILSKVGDDDAELFRAVRDCYRDHYGKEGDRLMLLYGQLLKIGGSLWLPAELVNTEADSKQLSEESSKNSSGLSTSPAP